MAHRVAWAIYHGKWPDGTVDHINGDRADNRIANLRVLTIAENSRNAILRSDNKVGRTGITMHRGKYKAAIKVDGKTFYLGISSSLEKAIQMREDAERHYDFDPNHGKVGPHYDRRPR